MTSPTATASWDNQARLASRRKEENQNPIKKRNCLEKSISSLGLFHFVRCSNYIALHPPVRSPTSQAQRTECGTENMNGRSTPAQKRESGSFPAPATANGTSIKVGQSNPLTFRDKGGN